MRGPHLRMGLGARFNFPEHRRVVVSEERDLDIERYKSENPTPSRKHKYHLRAFSTASENSRRPPTFRALSRWIWKSLPSKRESGESSNNILENRMGESQIPVLEVCGRGGGGIFDSRRHI